MGEIKVVYDKIANGLDDVAKYLGLNPEKTIFLHSTSFDESEEKNIKRIAINKGRMLYSEILSYSSNNKNGAKSVITYYNEEMLKYYEEIGLISLDNIILVGENKKIDYPYNSVSTMLNKRLKESEDLRKKLEGFTIVSSYLSFEDEENAKLINGSLIMGVKEQEKFNSKYEFRRFSEKYGFSMPKGATCLGVKKLNDEILKLKESKKVKDVWIKLESQSSGTGNLFVKDVINTKLEEIENKVLEIAKKIYDNNYIFNEMPLIIEEDVNSIKNEKEIENIGVEAVISKDKVVILGGVSQATKDGAYLGSQVTESTYKYEDVAMNCAKDAFIAMAKEGYRGFMTIDVLVTKNEITNEVKTYNIDPNARFSAGTMLLKNIHSAEVVNNTRIYGMSYSNAIFGSNDIAQDIKKASNDIAYNINSKKLGIIPALVNDVTKINNDRYYLKSVVLDTTYEGAINKFDKFKEYFK